MSGDTERDLIEDILRLVEESHRRVVARIVAAVRGEDEPGSEAWAVAPLASAARRVEQIRTLRAVSTTATPSPPESSAVNPVRVDGEAS